MPDKDKLAQLLFERMLGLQKAEAIRPQVPDRLFGIPGVRRPQIPGTGTDIMERDIDRIGLPGATLRTRFASSPQNTEGLEGNWWSGTTTPRIDPRLVDPTNNPMMSQGGLTRGDISLYDGREDIEPKIKYFQTLQKLEAAEENASGGQRTTDIVLPKDR